MIEFNGEYVSIGEAVESVIYEHADVTTILLNPLGFEQLVMYLGNNGPRNPAVPLFSPWSFPLRTFTKDAGFVNVVIKVDEVLKDQLALGLNIADETIVRIKTSC